MTQATEAHPFTVHSLDCFTDEQVDATLKLCERLLMKTTTQIRIRLSREWARRFPKDAGVYAVFDKGRLIYVGETASLRARMADFLDSRNHVLRRCLGNTPFKDEQGFRRASSHERFPDHIEKKITAYIMARLSVAAVVVPLGRAEIDEHLMTKHCPLFNSKGKRGTKLHGIANKGGAS